MKPLFRPVRKKIDYGVLELRGLRGSDARDVARVLNKPLVRRFTTFPQGVRTSVGEVLDQLRASEANPAHWYIAAFLDGRYVGRLVVFRLDTGKRAHVAEFGTSLDGHYGTTVEKQLVGAAEAFLTRQGVRKLLAGVIANNVKSKRLYEKMGYQTECVMKRNVFDGRRFWDEILLSKWLPA
ncbi:GNAT family N-acetyltransferase [Candidatus Micrarchaeota archaeon]|nr:GNAT family N-acetyltransferase [Candidatus Micrarchaeota archaeon]